MEKASNHFRADCCLGKDAIGPRRIHAGNGCKNKESAERRRHRKESALPSSQKRASQLEPHRMTPGTERAETDPSYPTSLDGWRRLNTMIHPAIRSTVAMLITRNPLRTTAPYFPVIGL